MDESFTKVAQRLGSLKPELSEKFVSVLASLQDAALQDPGFTRGISVWVDICEQLASSGWHSWESTLAYIDISMELLQKTDKELLLSCGGHAIELSQISHEPATAYLRGLGELLSRDLLDSREKWQQTGDLISQVHSKPSALLTEYFKLGKELAGHYAAVEFGDWIELAAQFTRDENLFLNAFLNVCKQARDGDDLPWSFCKELQLVSNRACIDYLSIYSRLSKIVDDTLKKQLRELLLKLASDEKESADFLQNFGEILNQEEDKRERILGSCLLLVEVHPQLVNCFLSSLDRLPLKTPHLLDSWVEQGLTVAKGNLAAGEAFFGLESATSQDLLQRLVGQVNFADNHRLFQYYSEGITGRRFKIEELKASPDSYRELPTSDGEHIYLPVSLNEFDEVHQNFLLYKLSLLHQLGFYECGTFDFWFADSSDPYATFFSQFENSELAAALFQILEDGRIDWYLMQRYKGISSELGWLMQQVLSHRCVVSDLQAEGEEATKLLLEALLQYTLGREEFELIELNPTLDQLLTCVAPLSLTGASIYDTTKAVESCYQVLIAFALNGSETEIPADAVRQDSQPQNSPEPPQLSEMPSWVPQPVFYRGRMNPDEIMLNLQLASVEELLDDLMDGNQTVGLSDLIDQSKVKIEQLAKGDVRDAMGMFLTDLENQLEDGVIEEELEESLSDLKSMLQLAATSQTQAARIFYYDEWDYLIQDYRRNWCRLHEITLDSDDQSFVEETVSQHKGILTGIRRQLQMLKPELQRKVKGLLDGEEIDLDRAVDSIVDMKAGYSANDKIYVQRLKKERDVAALFLLDMSASTDDRILDPSAAVAGKSETQVKDEDDFLETFYGSDSQLQDAPRRRIIDVEKESVVLMAEALEELGDSYAVCGFSGYGKDQVDYYLCKDFNEKYSDEVKGRISAIKPCRSTRMGPAIRHATNQLAKTESRIKALIIISDGYPQDFDYGKDRNLREYGIQDTTKALSEARHKGVQTFCLTVDPSGHDYLREMCPDQQYMVIQDINQLPNELSKVYHGLTS